MVTINVEKRRTVDPMCAPAFGAAHYALTEHSARIVRNARYSPKDRLSAFLTITEARHRLEAECNHHSGRELNMHPKYYPCHISDRQPAAPSAAQSTATSTTTQEYS